jgi:hypothetical protein
MGSVQATLSILETVGSPDIEGDALSMAGALSIIAR